MWWNGDHYKNQQLGVEHGESDAASGLGFAIALCALIVFIGLTVLVAAC